MQTDVLADPPCQISVPDELAGKSLDENSAAASNGHSLVQAGASRIEPQDWAATEVTAGTD